MIGDGNFSFSLALAKKNAPLSFNLIVTSLETLDKVVARPGAAENIQELQRMGVTVLHSVDGTSLKDCKELAADVVKFDTIIFNFPHVGGKGNLKQNRQLLHNFFKSAVDFLKPVEGEIHVTLCQGQGGTPSDCTKRGYENTWKIVEMAAESGLMLTRLEAFEPLAFPSYCPTGYRGQDKGFLLQGALIHVFTLPQLDPSPSPWRRLSEASCYESCSFCFQIALPPAIQLQLSSTTAFIGLPAIEENLKFSALSQAWHPLTLITDMVEKTLKQSNCLWKSVDVLIRQQVIVHRLPSDCVPDEGAAKASLYPVIFHDQPPELATTDPQRSSNHCASIDQSPLLCLQHTAELEIPRLATILIAAGPCEPVLQLVFSPSVRNPPISLHASDQPLTHELVGVFSVRHLLEEGQSVESILFHFEMVMTELLREVLGNSSHLTSVNKSRFLWQPSNESAHLRSCRELRLDTSEDVLIGPVVRFGQVSYRPRVASGVGDMESSVLIGFMLYLESLAMLHFGIEDVRLFWSKDTRFRSQFLAEDPRRVAFKPFNLFPPTYTHDVSFWGGKNNCSCTTKGTATSEGEFSDLQLAALVRRLTNNCAVSLQCVDTYLQPASEVICGDEPKISYCYRLLYRSADRALSRSKAAALQLELREALRKELGLELR